MHFRKISLQIFLFFKSYIFCSLKKYLSEMPVVVRVPDSHCLLPDGFCDIASLEALKC